MSHAFLGGPHLRLAAVGCKHVCVGIAHPSAGVGSGRTDSVPDRSTRLVPNSARPGNERSSARSDWPVCYSGKCGVLRLNACHGVVGG